MTFSDITLTLKAIRAMKQLGMSTTGHCIAKNMAGKWSRSTTYRKLKKLQTMGLIKHVGENHDTPRWIITASGRYMLDNQEGVF